MPIKFPVSAIEGQIFTYSDARKYIFTGGRWKSYSNAYVLSPENVNFATEPYVGAQIDEEGVRVDAEVSTGDAATLAAAKLYADQGDDATLAAAQAHTDAATDALTGASESFTTSAVAAGLQTAQAYTETQADAALQNAKAYSNSQDEGVLQAAQAYADALVQALDMKASVTVATTENIVLSGTKTIDGYTVVVGDTVLVKDQTNGAKNGIYVVKAGSWTRRTDANTTSKVTTGLAVPVEKGDTNQNTTWTLVTKDPVLDTTSLVFTIYGASVTTDNSTLRKLNGVLSADPSITPYDIGSYVIGMPNPADVLARLICVRGFNLPQNLAGSSGVAVIPATDLTVFTIMKNDVSIGSFQFAAAATVATFTFPDAVTFVANDVITIHSPDTQDATLADIAFTFMGNLQ